MFVKTYTSAYTRCFLHPNIQSRTPLSLFPRTVILTSVHPYHQIRTPCVFHGLHCSYCTITSPLSSLSQVHPFIQTTGMFLTCICTRMPIAVHHNAYYRTPLLLFLYTLTNDITSSWPWIFPSPHTIMLICVHPIFCFYWVSSLIYSLLPFNVSNKCFSIYIEPWTVCIFGCILASAIHNYDLRSYHHFRTPS